MPGQSIPLLCKDCGRELAQLQPAEIPADVRGFLTPLAMLARMKLGAAIGDALQQGNPIAALRPSDLAAFLGARCTSCLTTAPVVASA